MGMRSTGLAPAFRALCLGLLGACSPHRGERAAGGIDAAPAPATLVAQFDALWSRFRDVYPAFAYKQVDWERQRDRYRSRAMAARSQDELIAVMTAMLAPLRDRHIWFIDPRGAVVPTYRPIALDNFERPRWERAMQSIGYTTRTRELGDASIGPFAYLFIGSWREPIDTLLLDQQLERARDAAGLIIDVRANAGGSDATALAFARRFTRHAFAASYVQVRTEARDVELPLERVIRPRGSWQFTRPVVVISGRGGLSATESFVAALRTLPHVTVIGDTTGGASGNPVTLPLANGWRYTLPRWMEFGPDLKPIEWRGVAPHVPMPWIPGVYHADRDPLVDAAVGVLGERLGAYRIAPLEPEPEPVPRDNLQDRRRDGHGHR